MESCSELLVDNKLSLQAKKSESIFSELKKKKIQSVTGPLYL